MKNLLMILTLIFLIGCGKIDEKELDTKEEKRDYTISWTAYQRVPTEKNGDILKYIENLYNVDINLWNLEHNNYNKLLDLNIAAGEIPDLFRMKDTTSFLKYVSQGKLISFDLNELEKNAPNIYSIIKKYTPEYFKYGKINGEQYGIPIINTGNIYRKPLVYRKDWMEKLGIKKTPETLEEFEKVMYAFAKDDPDGNGKDDTYGLSNYGFTAVFGAFGLVPEKLNYFIVKNNKVSIAAIQPEAKEALKYLRKWYKDGVLDPDFVLGENTGGYWALSHAFINGKIGFSSNGNYYHWIPEGEKMPNADGKIVDVEVGANIKEIKKIGSKAKVTFGNPLEGPYGKKGIRQYNLLSGFYGFGTFANEKEGKLKKIMEIFDTVSTSKDKIYSLGIEGKHWEYTDKTKNKTRILPPYDKEKYYLHRIGGNLGESGLPIPEKDEKSNWAKKHNFDKYGIKSAIPISVSSLAKYNDKLSNLREEVYTDIILGNKPLDYFDEFVKEFNENGGSEITKEANEFYKGIN